MKKIISSLLILFSVIGYADTPAPGIVKVRGGTDGTVIGNISDSLKVDVTNSISATLSGPVSVTQATSPWVTSVSNFPASFGVTQLTSPWLISGNTGRTWTLLNSTDSMTSFQGGSWTVGVNNFPSTFGVTQSTSPWIVNGSSFTQPISAVSLPLPVGAATEATLSTLNGKVTTTANGIKVDGSAVTQPISGSVSISNFPGTQPVSGTVTANQGTAGGSAWLVNGSGFTQPVSGTGNFTVVQPTGTNLHTTVDNFPATFGVTQSTSPWVVSGTVTANAGTGTFQTNVTNASLTVVQPTAANLNATVVQGTSPWVTSGTTTISGTVGVTQSTSPWVVSGTVTSNIGTTGGLALDTTVSGLQVSQGSTTSGQQGNLVQGAITTSAPTYTTGQTNALSLNTSGGLRVDGSGVTQPISGTVTANAGTGNFTVVQTTGTNLHTVTDSGSTTTVTQSTAANLNATVVQSSGANLHVNVDSAPTTSVTQGTSPWVVGQGTASNLNAQVVGNVGSGSSDSGNPVKIGTVFNSTQPTVTNGQRVDAQATARGGLIVATGTDTFTVTANAGTNLNTSALALSANQTNGTQKTQQVDGSGNVQPAGDTQARGVNVIIGDGTNVPAVKAASTAAAAADKSLVVALSPNSPLPAGTTAFGYLTGHPVLSTFTQSYSSSNLTTGAFTTLISSTSADINSIDIFDTSGSDYYIAYAATCGALSNGTNAIIVSAGGGGKDFRIPSGNCLGFEAKTATISSGSVNMTFYK